MNEAHLTYIMPHYYTPYHVAFIGQMDTGQTFNSVGLLLMDLNGNMSATMMNNGKERCLKGIR